MSRNIKMVRKEIPDRRRGLERRTAKRYSVTLDIEWDGQGERHTGTISDISTNGCFVLSGIEINDGDSVTLMLPLGEGMKVQFTGAVTNHVREIGFAMRFDELSEAQRSVLVSFLEGEQS